MRIGRGRERRYPWLDAIARLCFLRVGGPHINGVVDVEVESGRRPVRDDIAQF